MKISDLVSQATEFLRTTSPSARLDAELIISDTLKCRREDLYTQSHKEIAPQTLSVCLQKIERRIQGEPIAYITNKKDFLNYSFYIEEGVLIPRPETELLVEYALHFIETSKPQEKFWVLDIGSGSGCIGVSILNEVSNAYVVALDISKAAEAVSSKNAELYKVQERFHFVQKDADAMDFSHFEEFKKIGFSGAFDIVISNPPYISFDDSEVEKNVKKYEPEEALFCKESGLEKIKKWTNLAGSLLKPEGLWIFEIGYKQGPDAKNIVQSSGFFHKLELAQDYSGKDRFIIAHKNGEAPWTKLQS